MVSPSWWTDLWLNEGFASYVEYLGVEAVEPQMKIMDQFVTSEVQRVMKIEYKIRDMPKHLCESM